MAVDNRHYDRLADAWWDPKGPMGLLLRMNQERARYFLSVLPNWDGRDLLDVGCGGGFLAEAFAQAGARVWGMDLSFASVRTARDHAARRKIHVRWAVARAEALPVQPARFDAVLLADILEHLEDFRCALAEAARVLKPGGLLLYETANRTWLSLVGAVWCLERILRRIPLHTHEWRMFIRPAELVQALASCGLRNEELLGLGLKGGVLGFLLRSLGGGDPWRFEVNRDTRVSYLGYAVKPAR